MCTWRAQGVTEALPVTWTLTWMAHKHLYQSKEPKTVGCHSTSGWFSNSISSVYFLLLVIAHLQFFISAFPMPTIRCQINVPVRFEKNFWGWGGVLHGYEVKNFWKFAWVRLLGRGTIFLNTHSPKRQYDFWVLWSQSRSKKSLLRF